MATPTHVWMLNMGGPDRPEAIQPFLQSLLSDPAVVGFPFRWMSRLFGWVISKLRAPKILPDYERMGGASPQLAAVERQARQLGRVLGPRYQVRPVFRYMGPSARDAAQALGRKDQVVLLSLYPHACGATTGTSLRDARRALDGHEVEVVEIESYPDDPGYVEALAETLRAGIGALTQTGPTGPVDYHVVFSAHGIPEARTRRGDPYAAEIQRTVDAVVTAVDLQQPHHLSFQSRVGPTRWLGPSTVSTVQELGAQGVEAVVIVPISFTSDHIETLVELDEQLATIAREAGVRRFSRAPTVDSRPTFIHALAELVRSAERRAEWAVPEDAIQAEIAALLKEKS